VFRLWISDLESPSYFVASAAVALGFFKSEGIDVELIHEPLHGPELMRQGSVSFVAGSAYIATEAFPSWSGLKILCALSQYSYWFMAVRADLAVRRGDLNAIKGLRITSSMRFPSSGLRHMLAEAGLDLNRDNIEIVPPPPVANTGLHGVEAITRNLADAYWGNGMRVALGEELGVAKVHLDLRRGDGPPGARFHNFPALTTTDKLIQQNPDVAAAAIRAIVNTQKALKATPSLATQVGQKLLPHQQASLIGKLVERDTPFYAANISHEAVDGLMKLGMRQKLLSAPVAYNDLVATQFQHLWETGSDQRSSTN